MLHGNILINENVIGIWTAINTDRRTETGLVIYAVKVDYRNLMGHPMVAEFEVEHDAGYGAVTLTAKIFTEVPKHLKRKELDTPGLMAEYLR